MANVETVSPLNTPDTSAPVVASLLVALSPTSSEGLATLLSNLRQAFEGESVIVTSPDIDGSDSAHGEGLLLVPRIAGSPMRGSWVLTPPEFAAAHRQAVAYGANACLLLGPESHSLQPAVIRSLADAVTQGGADLCAPDYSLGAREGLVNSALLYPLSRALYYAQPRFPLALDLAISLRLAGRLAAAAERPGAAGEANALLWPVAEAAVAGMKLTQVAAGHRTFPPPATADLNALLAQIAGSLFADIEARATFWQRSRPMPPNARIVTYPAAPEGLADVEPLISGFRVAYTNLSEIWSLVLPPQSLLGLKRLAQVSAATFRMPPALWARIVYDFVLAYRLRTLNRGHLLGALTPLYLAWVASHLLMAESGISPEQHVDETALAFETEKPYFVSRWRWPDRFNP